MRAAIVLAGGASRRFGRADKLRAMLGGRPLIAHALARARESGAHRIILVLRRRPRPCPLGEGPMTIVIARTAALGLSASLRAGLAALRPIEREAWIFLADMPLAGAPRRMRLDGAAAARPIVGGIPGHPMLVKVAAARRAVPQGDRGLGGLPAERWRGDAGNILDIDDQAMLRRLRYRLR